MLSKSIVFCLDARASFTAEELDAIKKYGLGKQVIYNSSASKKHLEDVKSGNKGLFGSAVSLAMASLNLNITVDGLNTGQHIEAKDLDEMLGAEEALKEACRSCKAYLDIAKTFDGSEHVVEF